MTKQTTKRQKSQPQSEDDQKCRIRWSPGWAGIPNKLIRNNKLSRGARLLWSVMATFANDEWHLFPHQSTLAAACADPGQPPPHVRTIRRWAAELEKHGWLATERLRWGNDYELLEGKSADQIPDDPEPTNPDDPDRTLLSGDDETGHYRPMPPDLGIRSDRTLPSGPYHVNKNQVTKPKKLDPPPYPPLGEAADAAGAAGAAWGGAGAPGRGPTGDWPSGTGDAASAATGVPGGAGASPPVPAAPSPPAAGQVYPESLTFLDEVCKVKTFRRYGHIPLPILERRWAAKQSANDPSAAMAADLRDNDVTPKEWAWLDAEQTRAERGYPATPPELGVGVDHVRNHQVREQLLGVLAQHRLDIDFLTVTVWPTAEAPDVRVDVAVEADLKHLPALAGPLLQAVAVVTGIPASEMGLEATWAILPRFPKAPAIVAPEAAPSRAVERVESDKPAHRIAAWWSTQAAWDHQLAVAQANKDPQLAVAQLDRLFIHLKNGSWEGGWIVAANKNPRVQRELDTIHRQRIIDLAQAGGQLLNPPAGPPAPAAGPDLSRFSDYRKAG